jgi:integrase
LDWRSKFIILEPGTTKNNESRVFPFANYSELEQRLLRQKAYSEEIGKLRAEIVPRVFHRNGEAIRDFRGAWDSACDAEHLAGRWVHDLRRSAVRRMEMCGLPRALSMKLTGHETESIFLRYACFSQKDLEEGVGKLAAFRETPDEKKVESIG